MMMMVSNDSNNIQGLAVVLILKKNLRYVSNSKKKKKT